MKPSDVKKLAKKQKNRPATLILNGGRFKPAFAKRDKKIDFREISTTCIKTSNVPPEGFQDWAQIAL
jgi:hypothetical protein